MAKLITPSKGLGYSDMYIDFVSGLDKARHFYTPDGIADVAARLDAITYDRARLADILTKQNKAWGAGDATMAAIESLRHPKALCIFAGQQAGLFGGPLLVQVKALGILKAARRYCEELGRPIVPIFWIAGDDHDFEEVNHINVLDRSTSELVKVEYSSAPEQPIPTSEIRFSDKQALADAKTRLREALGETDFTPDLYNLIDRCYTPDDTFVSAFGKLMTALLGKFGLVLFSPSDPDVKELAAPFLQQVTEKQERMQTLLAEANEHISKQGYHLQVEKKDESTHLFCNLDGRRPVFRHNEDGFLVGERNFTRMELRQIIRKEPQRFSPDVITRPVMQSYLFPVLSQHGGPSEIAYYAQVNPLFALFNRVAPVHEARPTATFVERRYEKVMQQYGITFEDLTGDIEQAINRVLAESFPPDLEKEFHDLRKDLKERFDSLVQHSLQFDKQLESVAETFKGKLDHNLKQFEGKVFASHKRKLGQTRDRIYRLHHSLYPNRGLQERALNISYFLAKYGPAFTTFAHEQLDSGESAHQLISLSDL